MAWATTSRRMRLSRSRGTKAQQRKQQFSHNSHKSSHTTENTIDFNQRSRRPPREIELIPKSRAQEQLTLALLDPQTHITIAVGPAGTGKTYLAMKSAIRSLRAGECNRIVLTRPAVGVDDEQHGFLPGDLISKMEPWTRPLLDVVREFYHPKEIEQMIADQVIEISPLAYMRGRTFSNAWIIADEMQNATPSQMKMLLTRIGENSRIAVTGDVEQTDRSRRDNGLLDIAVRLAERDILGVRICHLTNRDIQRHPIITEILDLYQD